ncbi:hypothetical protein H4V97_001292 [Flavobacterium sp. CG_23.5]|uniref:hypothetical protein n=1 Tax=Flavobacterium sp. CG_23.5 TaxID=2760708 RepID=UPI001AE668CE|nr:hypothetical protein [Flavobacterium sp. CG_23.5]MBP2282974.1 hypothetical protein [Flavobacterium sp. CG_23.5]
MTERTNRNLIVFLMLVFTNLIFAQKYLLPNEKLIYGFETQNGKKLVLAKDKNDKYIIYRFGTKNKIEFEFPEKTKASWDKFKYAFYLRGGGIQNEGMDLNYIKFINGNYKYVIYDTYYAVENEMSIGIKITNLKNNKTTDIKGKKSTQKGNLVDFRFNKLLKIEDELEE